MNDDIKHRKEAGKLETEQPISAVAERESVAKGMAPKSATEQLILAVAEQEFMAKGLAGARTTEIARRAGVTHAMLHYYFRTKEQLFERIIAEKMDKVGEIVLSAFVESDMPLLEKIKTGVERHFDFVAENRSLPMFVMREIYSYPGRYAIMQARITEVAGRLLAELQADLDRSAAAGATAPVDARMLLLDIIALNIFSIISFPIATPILGDFTNNYEAFLRARKQENVTTILKRLQA
ncbi:MAG: TetR/AcrR family transcriptional regulator [Muribaculaceae bacterium]